MIDSHDPLAAMFDPSKKISKAERIRDYIAEYPDKGNKEIATALAEQGVKPQDVANARQQMKKKAASGKKVGRPRASENAKPAKTESKPAPSTTSSSQPLPNYVDMGLIDLGVAFVRQCGDIDRAEQVLTMIRKIRDL